MQNFTGAPCFGKVKNEVLRKMQLLWFGEIFFTDGPELSPGKEEGGAWQNMTSESTVLFNRIHVYG